MSGRAADGPQPSSLMEASEATLASLAGVQVLRVAIPDEAARAALIAMDESRPDMEIWEDDLGKDAFEVRVGPEARAALDAAGFEHSAVIADMAAWYEERFGGDRSGDFFDDLRTYDEFVTFLNDLAASYPDLATVVDLGKTVEGRHQWAIRITGPGPVDKPGLLYMGAEHGEEEAGPAVVAYLAQHLLSNYGVDPAITDVVNNVEWFLLPIMNADGYPTQRYNARGVDLLQDWGGPDPGSSPFSEPETANLERFFTLHSNVKGFITLHTKRFSIVWPSGYREEPTADHHTYAKLAREMAADIYRVDGTYLEERDTFAASLATYRGLSIDYTYGSRRIWSYFLQVSDRDTIAPREIRPTCERTLPSLIRFADWLWDCNSDGVTDAEEIAAGASDCNKNRTPDACEWQADCDRNGTIDICEGSDVLPECVPRDRGATIHVPKQEPTIQDAIDRADWKATIILSDGIYTGYRNTNIQLDDFYGTIRSENGPHNCIIDMEGFERGFEADFPHSSSIRIEGLTIRNGVGMATMGVRAEGGGIRADAAVTNCIISGNQALLGGGISGNGVYTDCLFKDNYAWKWGGGAHGEGEFINCVFQGNQALEEDGGGASGGRAYTNCRFVGNQASDTGGGVYAGREITDCWFEGNVARTGGGAQGAELLRCYFIGNEAAEQGGGSAGCSATSCLYRNNTARQGGAASGGEFLNCTIIDNVATDVGGGVTYAGLTSSIVRGNQPDQYKRRRDGPIRFSNIEGWRGGGKGNIDLDPLFVAPEQGDYRLLPDSPCVNTGVSDGNLAAQRDLDGGPRVLHCVPDMGAYESTYGSNPDCPCSGDEQLDVQCVAEQEGYTLIVRISGGLPGATLTLRLHDDHKTDKPVTLDDQGHGHRRVRNWPKRDVSAVSIVECGLTGEGRCKLREP